MFDDGEMSSALAFETMPLVSVNSGSSSGIPRGEHVDAGLDLAVEPVEERVAVALDVDDREVGALGHAEHPRRLRLVRTGDEDLDGRGARDDVVVGDRDAGRIDDEPAAGAGVARLTDLGIADGSVGLDAHHGTASVVDGGDRLAAARERRVRAVRVVGRDRRSGRTVVVVATTEHDDAADHERDDRRDRADDDADLLAAAAASTRRGRRGVGGRWRRGRRCARPCRCGRRWARRRGRRRRRWWGRRRDDAWLGGVVARHAPLLTP